MYFGGQLAGGSDGKESTCYAGASVDVGLIPGSGRFPGEGNGLPGEFHRQRSLVSYSSWGCKTWIPLSD